MILDLILILLSFINIIIFFPFLIFKLLDYSVDEVSSYYQPSNYLVYLIWTLINIIFGIINLNMLVERNINTIIKENILLHSIYESILQFLLYLSTSNYGNGRYFFQHIISFFIYSYLIKYCLERRRPYFAVNHPTSFYLYLPYTFWIFYLLFLNFDILSIYFLNLIYNNKI